MQATNEGTAFVIKLPGVEIESVRGTVPVGLTHELYAHPNAPVIRTLLRIYDQPDSHLALETYTNIADDEQRSCFAALGSQERFTLLFYDEQLAHQLTKTVGQNSPSDSAAVLDRAERVRSDIPQEQYDFDVAKQDVMVRTKL